MTLNSKGTGELLGMLGLGDGEGRAQTESEAVAEFEESAELYRKGRLRAEDVKPITSDDPMAEMAALRESLSEVPSADN